MATRQRSSWTSTGFGFNRRINFNNLKGLSVHWPGTNQKFANASWETIAAALRGYRNYHVNNNKWADIGYNFGITPSGDIVVLAGPDRVAAHSASKAYPLANHEWIGVLLLLGPGESPTKKMVDAFKELRSDVLSSSPKATQVRGHQQIHGTSTSCPGPGGLNLVRQVSSGSSSGGSSGGSSSGGGSSSKSVAQMASEVIAGKHGTGNANRARSLGLTTSQYEKVRAEVNRRAGGGSPTPTKAPSTNKTISRMADEVIAGKHGKGHAARQRSLGVSQTTYARVRQEVNNRAGVRTPTRVTGSRNTQKTVSQLAGEVLQGKHGNGPARKKSLGSRYAAVQREVNRRLR